MRKSQRSYVGAKFPEHFDTFPLRNIDSSTPNSGSVYGRARVRLAAQVARAAGVLIELVHRSCHRKLDFRQTEAIPQLERSKKILKWKLIELDRMARKQKEAEVEKRNANPFTQAGFLTEPLLVFK